MKQTERMELWNKLETGQAVEVADNMRVMDQLAEQDLVLRLQARYQTRDYRGALQDANAVLKMNSENVVAKSFRGLCYARLDRFAEAYPDLTGSMFFPHYRVLFEFLWIFWPLDFTDESLKAPMLNTESVSDPLDSAFQSFKESDKGKNKSLASKYRRQAVKSLNSDKFELLAQSCCRAYECDPDHAEALDYYINGLILKSEYKEASDLLGVKVIEKLEKYKETKDQQHLPEMNYLCLWAYLLHRFEDFDGSLALLGEIGPDGPFDFSMHYIAGLNWLMKGDREKSWACLEVAFRDFYFETWPMYLGPFKARVDEWLKKKAQDAQKDS